MALTTTRKRSMRFEVMEELAKKGSKANPISMNVEVTEEEAAIFDKVRQQVAENKRNGLPYDYNIPRVQLEMVGKLVLIEQGKQFVLRLSKTANVLKKLSLI